LVFYDDAWRRVRANLKYHRGLEDELLWHKVYEEYINSLPLAELRASRDELIERHLRIVGPIAGKIAWKRTPHSFGIWARESDPSESHVSMVHELTAMGNFVLFVAADRYNPYSGYAFSTYANYWIKKFVKLHLDEIISIVPRTGYKDDGRVSVMDRVNAALERRRLYRGKAAGGMAMFDQSITIAGPNPGDKEIETVGTDGPTLNPGFDYLQRRVSFNLYPWIDMGTRSTPRFALLGHAGGRASAEPPRNYTYKFDAADEIELRAPPIGHTGPSMVVPIPQHRIYDSADERRARAIKEASLQTRINPKGGKTWRKPTIRIHPYPKVMAMAAA
jgi:hypothetical protein